MKIPLPPNLYNDSTWMGLILCAYFAIDENPTAHLDLQQGGCILLSYEARGSFQNCLNQANCIKASFTTNCPGLKVEKCGLRLLYHYDLEEFEQMNSPSDDLEEFEQTISHSMNSSFDDGNRDKQKHDDEGTSSRTSSSRKESNFGSPRRPIDPKVVLVLLEE